MALLLSFSIMRNSVFIASATDFHHLIKRLLHEAGLITPLPFNKDLAPKHITLFICLPQIPEQYPQDAVLLSQCSFYSLNYLRIVDLITVRLLSDPYLKRYMFKSYFCKLASSVICRRTGWCLVWNILKGNIIQPKNTNTRHHKACLANQDWLIFNILLVMGFFQGKCW